MAADPVLAVPSVFSFWLLVVVFSVHLRFAWRGLDAGDFARLQLWTCIGGFISAAGSCVHSLGFYSERDPGVWCQFESWCSSFGELSVVLWLMMTCVYFYAHLREYTVSADFRKRMFRAFHALTWPIALVLTAVPAGAGVLGLNSDRNDEYWCWFTPGHSDWEWAQFYGPLLLYTVVSVVTFVCCLLIIIRRLRSPLAHVSPPGGFAATTTAAVPPSAFPSDDDSSHTIALDRQHRSAYDTGGSTGTGTGTGSASSTVSNAGGGSGSGSGNGGDSDLTLYMRLALQFFVLFLVFLPDLFVVLVDAQQNGKSLYAGSRGAEFLWKCEGLMVALLWMLNGRVRTLFWSLPEVHAALWRCGKAHRMRGITTAATATAAATASATSPASPSADADAIPFAGKPITAGTTTAGSGGSGGRSAIAAADSAGAGATIGAAGAAAAVAVPVVPVPAPGGPAAAHGHAHGRSHRSAAYPADVHIRPAASDDGDGDGDGDGVDDDLPAPRLVMQSSDT